MPNSTDDIEVEIDGTDKPPCHIRPYNAKEDKAILDREMNILCY